MKKFVLFSLALAALFACQKNEEPNVEFANETVNVGFEGSDGEAFVELKANRAWKLTTDGQDWYSVEPMEGTGDATLHITVKALEKAATRAAEVKVTAETAMGTFQIVQGLPEAEAVKSGSFVIEEVFFAGVVPEGSTSSDSIDGDQYIKITNNTKNLLYADKLAIALMSKHSQNGGRAYYEPTVILKDSIAVNTVYRIPGNGQDVPVLPGHSLVIAVNAQNFEAENGLGIDLSHADFEFFDGEDVDLDNPDVPNMELWTKYSNSYTSLNNRGYFSMALVAYPESFTAESYIKDWPWVGTEKFIMDGELLYVFDIDPGYYLVRNEWVIDGINLGVEQEIGRLAFNASIDAGYTGCGTVDRDPNRYGKTALRKSENGVFVDTNNSTNDFTRDSTPTLKK